MTLFPTTTPKRQLPQPAARDRSTRRLPTGTPRLVESSSWIRRQAEARAWQALLAQVRQSSAARLAIFGGRSDAERIACTWERLTGCTASCRCGGTKTVTVGFLRAHYTNLADDLARFACPVPAPRRRRS